MVINVMCHRNYPQDGHLQVCKVDNKECPLWQRDYKKLAEPPCCFGLWIPARFLTEAKGDVQKAARRYIEECVL